MIKTATAMAMAVFFCASCSRYLTLQGSEGYLAGPAIRDYQPENLVEEHQYPCSVPGPEYRRMIVYLPRDYYDSGINYPVVYLLHGARGYETAWIRKGQVYESTDSLWRNGLAKPCIIVMPNINQYNDEKDYDGGRYKNAWESIWEIDGKAEWSFVKDVVEFVDNHYRTIPDKEHRAIAGLSVGGIQSIYFGANSPDVFGWIVAMSPYFQFKGKHHAYYHAFYDNLYDKMAVEFGENPPCGYYLFAGKKDLARPKTVKHHRYMEKMGYAHSYEQYPGSHNWKGCWIPEYRDILPKLFN